MNLINAILDQGLSNSRNSHVYPDCPDKKMLNLDIQRVLGYHVSCRNFLQYLEETDERKRLQKQAVLMRLNFREGR